MGDGKVSLPTLDALVTSFLRASEGSHQADLAQQVFDELRAGNTQRALELLLAQRPELLQDQRLLFKLRKQQFQELALSGDPQQLKGALALARSTLAPLALDAYPEAYSEFKHSMLHLLSQPGTEQQCGLLGKLSGGEAVLDARQQLAGMVYRTVREALGVRDPAFTVLLRYLLLVHEQQLQHMQSLGRLGLGAGAAAAQAAGKPQDSDAGERLEEGSQELSAASRALLLGSCDPMPLPVEGSAAQFPESQVQALRTALGCDREEAVALMRHAGGNSAAALRNAVQATHLDNAAVLQLAQDYAIFRGLDVPALPHCQPQQPAMDTSSHQQDDAVPMDTAEDVQRMAAGDMPAEPVAAAAAAAAAAAQLPSQDPSKQPVAAQGEPTALRAAELEEGKGWEIQPPAKVPRAGGRRSPSESIVSTPQESTAALAEARLKDMLAAVNTHSQGQVLEQQAAPPAEAGSAAAPNGCSTEQQHGTSSEQGAAVPGAQEASSAGLKQAQGNHRPPAGSMNERELHGLIKRLRGLLEQGLSEEVEEQLEEVSRGFVEAHPEAVFLVRRCHFLHLLHADGLQAEAAGVGRETGGGTQAGNPSSSNPAAALAFVRAQMSPLAQERPSLQPLLRSCLAALLPAPGVSKAFAGSSLAARAAAEAHDLREAAADAAAAVHAELRQLFNIQEPKLLRLLGQLLVSHSVHFMAQRCKDGFEAELGIPQLRGAGVLPEAEQQWQAARQARASGTAGVPLQLAAGLAEGLEDGLFGTMGPIFRQLRRLAQEEMPAPFWRAAPGDVVEGAEEAGLEGGAHPGGEPGGPPEQQGEQDEGGVTEDMDEDSEEEEGEEGEGEEWQQQQGQGAGQGAAGEEGASEESILLVQEFSGLPRGQAIELLLLFGSPQAVMAHLFP